MLVRVAAVVRAGRANHVVRGRLISRHGYRASFDARVTQASSLARALVPPARPRTTAGPPIGAATTGMLTLACLQIALTGAGSASAWVATVVFATVTAGFATALQTRSQYARAQLVRDGAMALWQASWYCHRCDLVSVLTPNASATVQVPGLWSALTELSRRAE